MIYCIYTGKMIADESANVEHIFPLTLGGHDKFILQVSKESNSRVNKEIDQKLKDCFFLSRNRKEHQAKGHRKKDPSPPQAKITVGQDTSVVLKFDDTNNLQLYSHRKSRFLTAGEIKIYGATFNIRYESSLRSKFTAKVALAAGFFIYGDKFVKNVKIKELRSLMNYRGEDHEKSCTTLNLTGWHWPNQVQNYDQQMHGVFEAINEMFGVSFIAFITSAVPDKIIVVVGVLGQLVGVISCEADCEMLPKLGSFDLGHVVTLRKNGVHRMSYRKCLQMLASNVS